MATVRSVPVDLDEAVPTDRLVPWLRTSVPDLGSELQVVQLAGGASNLTFRISDGARHWVLRRPPLRGGLSTAHDMTREFRVQGALGATDVPVAAMVAECPDEDVLGAPFYVMEWLDGIVYDDADAVAGLTDAQSRAASFELVDVLARLHSVDVSSIGLADFGRPTGFLERQMRRWTTQWEASKTVDLPDLEELGRRLSDAIPADSRSSIVHGDYSFNNTMFRSDDPTRMLAALDWELSTLGDPLTDVGTLTVYWGEAGEIMWRDGTPQAHRANDGFAGTDELLERYSTATGADLDRIDVYQAFALFKLAVISQGSLHRTGADPARAARTIDTIGQLTALALQDPPHQLTGPSTRLVRQLLDRRCGVEIDEGRGIALHERERHVLALPAAVAEGRQPDGEAVGDRGPVTKPDLVACRHLVRGEPERLAVLVDQLRLARAPIVDRDRALEEVAEVE